MVPLDGNSPADDAPGLLAARRPGSPAAATTVVKGEASITVVMLCAARERSRALLRRFG